MWLCTPPSETRPIRCSADPRPRRQASTSTAFSKNAPDATSSAIRTRSWRTTRPGAEVEVADLGVPQLPVGQADGAAGRRRASCAGSRPRCGRTRACRRARRRCPARAGRGPSRRARPARPARSSRRGGDRQEAARPRGWRRRPGRRRCPAGRAAPRRSPASCCRRTGSARLARRGIRVQQAADEGVHLLRLVRRRRAAGADRPDRLVGDRSRPRSPARVEPGASTWRSSTRLASRPPRARPRSRRRRGSTSRPASQRGGQLLGHAPRRSRRTAGAARSGRGARRRRRASSSIGAEISPVNAPCGVPMQFCADTRDAACPQPRRPPRPAR